MLRVDMDLFAAAQAGDRTALERLLAQLQPDIRRYARFQCYPSSSIEDVVQEALIVVYRRVGAVRSPAALGAWLVRVVARLCALPALMFMRSVEELKTIEDSMRFAHVPGDQLRLDVARPRRGPEAVDGGWHMKMPTCSVRHRSRAAWLVRGVAGFALLAVALSTREPLVAIPALAVALVAFRGCPMCWLFGLLERGAGDTTPPARKEVS